MSKKKDEKVIICYNCGKKCKIHKCPCGAEDWQCVCGCGSEHTHEILPDKNVKCIELKKDRKGLENWDKQALIEEFEIAITDEITLKKFIKEHCDLIFDYDDKQIAELKQQLAEKDKEITMLKSQNQFFMEETKRLDQISNLKDQEIEQLKANQTPTRKKLTPKNWDKYNLADKLRYRNSQVKEALIRFSEMNEMEDVLRSQLTEKDKEIERLKGCIMSKEQVEIIIKKETDNIKKQVTKDATPIIYKECRHQICEKIKEKLDNVCFDNYKDGDTPYYLNWCVKIEDVKQILDQIEKGE